MRWKLALAWTIVCGAIFWGLVELETPIPAAGFGHREAAVVALEALESRSSAYGDYIVINTASSATGSPDGAKRWIVVCNDPGGTAATAIVVELSWDGERVLGFRRPGQTSLEPNLP